MKYYKLRLWYNNQAANRYICNEEQLRVIESTGYIIDLKQEASLQEYNNAQGTNADYDSFIESFGSSPSVSLKIRELEENKEV